MEQNENTILYNSNDYTYRPLLKVLINAKEKEDEKPKTVLRTCLLKPKSIVLYNHNEYLQCDIKFYKCNDIPDSETKQSLTIFKNIKQEKEENPDCWVWVSFQIIPNPEEKDVYLNLETHENYNEFWTKDEYLCSFCSPIVSSYVTTDNSSNTFLEYDQINNVVDFYTLSEQEKQFIKNSVYNISQMDYIYQKENKLKNTFTGLFQKSPEKQREYKNQSLADSLHMTEQEKQIFDPSILNISLGSSNSEIALKKLVGLDNVKEEIQKLKAKLLYRKVQKERGIFVENSSSMHMCFTGAPGTGKTTVARIITGILHDMGYVKENYCVEVNGQNLKGGYTGQTAIITKLVMKTARNRVLFIDEAYSLFDDYKSGYGKDAVSIILKTMEDERDNTIVIFAGYKDNMDKFLTMNDGLKSRINRYIDFKNYTPSEMVDIMISMLKKKKLYITEEALSKCMLVFKKASISDHFSNGRFVRNFVEKIEYKHASNTFNTSDTRRQDTITIDDISDKIVNELLTHSM